MVSSYSHKPHINPAKITRELSLSAPVSLDQLRSVLKGYCDEKGIKYDEATAKTVEDKDQIIVGISSKMPDQHFALYHGRDPNNLGFDPAETYEAIGIRDLWWSWGYLRTWNRGRGTKNIDDLKSYLKTNL